MERLIKNIANDSKVVFDSGRFDNWCVYVVNSNGSRNAPFDNQYLSDLLDLSKKYSDNKVYDDFVRIYNKTTSKIDNEVTEFIDNISRTYKEEDRSLIEKWFTVIYAGMIAEENKEGAIIAANLLNRRFLGIDLERKYLEISKCRKIEIENQMIAMKYINKIQGFKKEKQLEKFLFSEPDVRI